MGELSKIQKGLPDDSQFRTDKDDWNEVFSKVQSKSPKHWTVSSRVNYTSKNDKNSTTKLAGSQS